MRAVKQEFNGRRQRERDKCLQLDWLKADRIAAKYLAPTLSSGPPSHPSQLHQEPGSPGSPHEAQGDVYAEGACASPALYGRGTARCVWIVFVSGSWLCFVHAYPHHPHPPSTSEPLAHLFPPPLGLSIACPSASVSSAPHTHSSRFSRAGGGRNSSVPSNPSNPSNPFHIQTLQSLLYKTVMALFVLAFCNSSSSGVYYITKVTGANNRWTHGCPRFFCNNGHVRPPFLFSSGRRRRKTRTRIAKRPYARRHKQRGRTGGREDPPPPPVTAGRYN